MGHSSTVRLFSPIDKLPAGKNIRLFENPILERLTYVHPLLPVSVWGSLSVILVAVSTLRAELNSLQIISLFLAGIFVWTLAEYIMHRFFFHFKPKTPLGERIAFLVHGIHHSDPQDARRLLMPPLAAVVFAAVFWFFFYATLGAVYVKPFYSGFLVGYLFYDYIHFFVHFMNPRSRILKWLRKNHMLHHFSTPDLRYGVSSPFWDYIFKTRPQ